MPPPLDPQTAPPLERYCDLVLKGGVVDGVIYPGVLIELAREFRFQSLAGTSVGAIAAALAAACEYSRRFGSDLGFNEVLRKVPDELAKDVAPGRTMLRSLFQTDPALQRLFDTAVDAASAPKDKFWPTLSCSIWQRYQRVMQAWFVAGFLATLAGAWLTAVGKALVWSYLQFVRAGYEAPLLGLSGLGHISISDTLCPYVLGVVLGILAALGGLVLTLYREYQKLSGQPGFGFCSGLSEEGHPDALVNWLHRGLQGAAGLELDRPLTFQDLWSAPCGPKNVDGSPQQKSIDLRMMTTCVSHGRPYEMPMTDTSVRLFFSLKEWAHYFPPSVLAHLRASSACYTQERVDFLPGRVINGVVQNVQNSPHPRDIPRQPGEPANDFRELPVGELPVLVAVRLSMNFPLLFQAVPLWAIDHQGGRVKELNGVIAPEFRKCWFADGGVTSNFPLHIFDNPIPAWPTFGVYIDDKSRKRKWSDKLQAPPEGELVMGRDGQKLKWERTYFHTSGRAERWYHIDDHNTGSSAQPIRTSGFSDYLFAMVFTVKDWADKANLRMPGIRDRVVTVYKNDLSLGGLNLKLPGLNILNLAYDNGTKAGQDLAKKFRDAPPPFNPNLQGGAGWLDHRWVRFNAYLSAVKTHLQGLSLAAHGAHGTSSLSLQIQEATQVPPLSFDKCIEPTLSSVQATALTNALAALESLETALSQNTVVQPYSAQPQYELKARSRT